MDIAAVVRQTPFLDKMCDFLYDGESQEILWNFPRLWAAFVT